jgi:hypothetical protein
MEGVAFKNTFNTASCRCQLKFCEHQRTTSEHLPFTFRKQPHTGSQGHLSEALYKQMDSMGLALIWVRKALCIWIKRTIATFEENRVGLKKAVDFISLALRYAGALAINTWLNQESLKRSSRLHSSREERCRKRLVWAKSVLLVEVDRIR